MLRVASKSFWYLLSTVVLALTSILTVPVLIHALGGAAWAALSAGLSVGTMAGIGVAWGWGVVGPGLVAAASEGERQALYARSVAERVRLLPPFALAAVVLTLLLVPVVKEAAALQALAVALTGLASPWYFVGAMRPRSLFLWDTAPRALANILGAFLSFLTGSAIWFGVAQVAGALGAICLTHAAVAEGPILRQMSMSLRELTHSLKPHNPAVLTAAVAAVYLSLPLVVVTMIRPAEAPLFALGDRLLKWSVTGLTPLTQVLQGWMPARGGSSRRMRAGVGAATATGIALLVAITTVGPWFTALLSRNALSIAIVGCAAVGLSVFATTISRVLGPAVLVPAGRLRALSASAIAGAVVGLALLLPLLDRSGAVGALWAVAAAEITVTAVQMVVAAKILRQRH